MAMLALKTSAYRNAVSRLHREVSQEMWHDLWPQLAGLGGPDHVDYQRRPPAQLAQRRPGRALRSVPAARVARALRRAGDLGAGQRHPGRGIARSAPAPQAPADRIRARRQRAVGACRRKASAAEMRRAGEVLDPERVDHRIRPPLRHIQARHAAVPRCGAAEENPVQQGPAGADRDCRQGASRRIIRARRLSARSCSSRAIPICGSRWCSSKITT